MDLPRPGLLAAGAAAALSFEGSSSDDAACSAPSGLNAVSKKGLLGPEGFALWTLAAIVLKGESWDRAPGVLRGDRRPLDFFAAGDVGGALGEIVESQSVHRRSRRLACAAHHGLEHAAAAAAHRLER